MAHFFVALPARIERWRHDREGRERWGGTSSLSACLTASAPTLPPALAHLGLSRAPLHEEEREQQRNTKESHIRLRWWGRDRRRGHFQDRSLPARARPHPGDRGSRAGSGFARARASPASSRRSRVRNGASRADSGSSSNSKRGSVASALASATRWRWPPDMLRGRLQRKLARSNCSINASTRRPCSASTAFPEAPHAELQVLLHRHVREEGVVLEHHADLAFARGQVDALGAVQQDVPAHAYQSMCGVGEPRDGLQHRRLARARGAHHRASRRPRAEGDVQCESCGPASAR